MVRCGVGLDFIESKSGLTYPFCSKPERSFDGGHVMFLLFEMISGRKPSEKFLERAQLVGFVILITLVLFANINDWI